MQTLSVTKLMQELGFKDSQEFQAFLNSARFQPFFDEYATQHIFPQQERARAEGSNRPRGVGLEIVERRLLSGERPGQDKFSCRRPDKTGWDNVDHAASMLYEIREMNTRSVQGLFYRKNLSEHEMHLYIWALVKYQEYNTAPSRKKNPKPTQTGNDDTMDLDNENGDPPEVFAPGDPIAEVVTVGKTAVHLPADEDAKPHRQLLDFLNTGEESFTGNRTLTNGERMCIENNGESFNITRRYWKAWTIGEVIGNQDNLNNLRSRCDYASNLNALAIEEQARFYQEISQDLKKDLIMLPDFSEEVRTLHDQQQTWMDNQAFQREDTEAACELLSIPWQGENTIFRTDQMSLSTRMEFWQPVAVKAIADFVDQVPALGGCVLADMMGIGKTWVVICFLMLHVNRVRAMRHTSTTPTKPTLILMPKKLIDQWMTQVDMVAPGFFTIYKYHGDARRHEPVVGDKPIQGRLSPQHKIFDGSPANASVIVVSSYSTFTERHGPSKQKLWRIKQLRMTKTESDMRMSELDPRWPERLNHMFSFVVLDEAHIIKQLSNKTSIAIKWLKAEFHILITATPIPNGIDDWKGYMLFIEHQDADQWWSDNSLNEMGFEEDMNPYELDDDHPAAELQVTTRATKDWIYANRIEPATKGLCLSRVWQQCMLRRTYSSRIPFNTGPTIGSKLPKVHAVMIKCMYDETERKRHDMLADGLTGALLIPGSAQRKLKWSFGTQRKLQMLTTSCLLPQLDAEYDLKATNLKKLFDSGDFYLKWFEEQQTKDPRTMLWSLSQTAPKLRALLRNVRSQVLRDQEKVIIFCQLPAVATFLYAVFSILQMEVVVMQSYHSDQERAKIIDTFNLRKDKAQILILTFSVGGTGLNLQALCFRVHIFESTTTLGIINQAIGRVRRLGNPSGIVYVYEYYVDGTLDDLAIKRNIEKAIPEAAATLNRVIFSEGEGEDADIEIGEWCVVDGQLVRYAEVDVDALGEPEILTPHELLRFILMSAKGQHIEV